VDGNVGPTTHWAVTDLPPSCLSQTNRTLYTPLTPPEKTFPNESEGGKRDQDRADLATWNPQI